MTAGPARAPRPRILPALALVAVLAACGCAHAPWNPYRGWKAVRTKHITLYTDTAFVHRNTLDGLEIAYAALAGSLFQGRSIAPVEVLFLENPQFPALLGRYRGGVAVGRLPGSGALARRGLVVLGEDSLLPDSAHALAHQFLHAQIPRAPLWLHEAYAALASTIEYRAGAGEQAACIGHLGAALPFIPLDDLFSWTWAQHDDSQKADWYRFTARSLLDYFLTADGGALRPKWARAIELIAGGRGAAEALAEALPGITIAALARKVVEHRRDSEVRPRGLCPVPFPIAAAGAADEGPPRREAVDETEIAELVLRLRLLPRRGGYVDWYPPAVLTLAGAREAR